MSETESTVTFVGGKAVEQSEGLESNLEVDEREAAKEAVRKAIKEAGEKSAEDAKSSKGKDPFKPAGTKSDKDSERSDKDSEEKESKSTEESGRPRGPDGKFLPTSKETESSSKNQAKQKVPESEEDESGGEHEEQLDPAKATVKQLLKAREKVAAVKREAQTVKTDIQRQQEEFRREQEAFQRKQWEFQQAQEQVRRQWEAFQNLRKDPGRLVREAGVDPEQFILDLAQEGTPEGQARRRQMEIDAQLAEIRQWKEQQAKQAEAYQRQLQEHQIVQARKDAINRFVNLALDEEKYPHVATFYKGHEAALVARGDLAAAEFRSLSGGREADFPDLLDYIEDQLAERLNVMYTKKGKGKTEATQVVTKLEPTPKPKSKGKSLNPEQSGERRTLQAKDLRDLDGDERIEAAKQAVAVALANSKE